MRHSDPRDLEACGRGLDDGRDVSRGGRGGELDREVGARRQDPRDVFTRDLALPRGPTREHVRVRGRDYHLRGSESRTLATVGAFRVIHGEDLQDATGQLGSDADLRHLRAEGLVEMVCIDGHRQPVVALTDRGRDLLEAYRLRGTGGRRQAFYAGLRKPREVEHDATLYRAYRKSADRLQDDGAEIHRVVLDYELKREYQAFLQEPNRDHAQSDGRPHRDDDEIADWARSHDLPYFDEHVHFPDVRIEYELDDGRSRYEDIEVVTPHYRGAHAAASAKAGFTRYRMASARIGGWGSHGGGGSRAGRSGGRRGPVEEWL